MVITVILIIIILYIYHTIYHIPFLYIANYVNADSPIHLLQRYWVPDRIKVATGLPLSKRDYIDDHDIER